MWSTKNIISKFFYACINAIKLCWSNQDKSAAKFCCQLAQWAPHMFCPFYLLKSHKIANNSTTAEAKEKISAGLESLEF